MVSISISASVARIMGAFSAARFHPNFIEATFLDPEGWNVEGSGPIDKEILQDKASAAAKLLVLGRKTWTKSVGLT